MTNLLTKDKFPNKAIEGQIEIINIPIAGNTTYPLGFVFFDSKWNIVSSEEVCYMNKQTVLQFVQSQRPFYALVQKENEIELYKYDGNTVYCDNVEIKAIDFFVKKILAVTTGEI